MDKLTALHPHLFNAQYNWLVENDLTVHLIVDSKKLKDQSLNHLADKEGILKLNISPRAIGGIEVTEEYIHFTARFSRVSRDVFVNFSALLALHGFDVQRKLAPTFGWAMAESPEDSPEETPQPEAVKPSRPVLKLVK